MAAAVTQPSWQDRHGLLMLCACIDIGSNTTRVLVADAREGRLEEVMHQRAFTRIGSRLRAAGRLDEGKVEEVAAVVAAQQAAAEALGAHPIRVVATAAIRAAANRDALCERVRAAGGLEVEVLDGEEEARLAFVGATRTMPEAPTGTVAVVDVGGGSSEVAVGTVAEGVCWWKSFDVGSGSLAEDFLAADPPSPDDLRRMREHARAVLGAARPPVVERAVAVGGSATSLRRLVGGVLDGAAVERALDLLTARPAAAVARDLGLEAQRVRLLPAGLAVLEVASRALGRRLEIARGGLREGVCLELSGGRGA
jgi:exopolyphosphatase / guanosine-5'-triphosphate,3'-diphosphate pyrophosphatase